MPTIITHSFTGLVSGAAAYDKSFPKRFWLFSIICSIIPDADVICFELGFSYDHFLGHRGFFHSLFFACILGSFMGFLLMGVKKIEWRKRLFFAGYFSFLISLHDILDAFTNGGLGVALLSPFDTTRYFSPYTPIKVSPINPYTFFNGGALDILKNEVLWVWLPYICIVIVFRYILRRRRKKQRGYRLI